jgi:replicative DNA helicase
VDPLSQLELHREQPNPSQHTNWLVTELKALARELRLPVVAAHHMSRRIEQGAERRPEMSDLDQGGERNADAVIFLYAKREEDRQSPNRLRYVDLAKQRSGPLGTLKLTFRAETLRFEDQGTRRGEDNRPPR